MAEHEKNPFPTHPKGCQKTGSPAGLTRPPHTDARGGWRLPKREAPLPAGAPGSSKRGLSVDGLRSADGYVVEAKYVREPGCRNTFRRLRVDCGIWVASRYYCAKPRHGNGGDGENDRGSGHHILSCNVLAGDES
ncbi:restriction endonuclease fold toxin-2 domain-containing protein [Streptomyces sp. C10]|uniref:restriction endonuclease fold toxin-2 domain-containing protein n=1 Tax=Streptomyces sp. C10 TaxID=531941 RepID=UPI0039801CD2